MEWHVVATYFELVWLRTELSLNWRKYGELQFTIIGKYKVRLSLTMKKQGLLSIKGIARLQSANLKNSGYFFFLNVQTMTQYRI